MVEKRPIVVIIPAKDEEHDIARTLKMLNGIKEALHRAGTTMHIIVVDDGSKDNTPNIAREMGAGVIQFIVRKGQKIEVLDDDFQVIGHRTAEKEEPVNRGKAAAFFAGMKEAAKINPAAVLTFDADMRTIRHDDFAQLTEHAIKATKQKRPLMVVAGQTEGSNTMPNILVSGIRGYSLPAVQQMIHSSTKGRVRRFGLESFLNEFFVHRTMILRTVAFTSSHPFRRGKSTHKGQLEDRARFSQKKLGKRRRNEKQRRLPHPRYP